MKRLLVAGWNSRWLVHLVEDDQRAGIEIRLRSLAPPHLARREFFRGDLAAAQAHVDQSLYGPMQRWTNDRGRRPPAP
jgi:hypothetical protein